MAFLEDQTVLDIMSQHLEQVRKLEEQQASKMLKLYKEIRRELRDRLDFLPGDTFSAQQLRGTLLQVELAIAAMGDSLNRGMSDASQILAELGLTHLVKETEAFSEHFEGAVIPINIDAVAVGAETTNFLLNQKEASLQAYSEGIRSDLTRELTKASIAQEPLSKVTTRLSKFFIGEEWRLLRIARTELHNVYNLGKLNGMQAVKEDTIPDLKKTLIHPMDQRTGEDSKALAQDNPIVPINKPFRQRYKGKERVYMHPPDRPNDRSILVPVRDMWAKAK